MNEWSNAAGGGSASRRWFAVIVVSLLMAGLVGAALVLVGDFIGQQVLPARYPVGIVTGALGAPFLVYLIVRANRTGAL